MKKFLLVIFTIGFLYCTNSAQATDLNLSWSSGQIQASNVTANSALISWWVNPGEEAVTNFRLYQNGSLLATIRDTKYKVSGLNPNTTYTFKVEAGNENDIWSTNGPSINVNTSLGSDLPIDPNADTSAPDWLDGYITKTDISQTSASLAWDGATDNVGIKSYRVYIGNNIIGTTTRDTFNLTGLTAGKTYSIKIEAGDEDGNWSTDGPHVYLTTLETKSNPYWTNSTLTAKNISQSSLTLTWSGAKDNVAVTNYKVFKNITFIKSLADTTIEITGLQPDTYYNFQVEAGDASGNWSTNGPRQQFKTLAYSYNPTITDNNNNIAKLPNANSFTDITRHWAEDNILELHDKGIISGISKDTFAPNKYVTRAEFAAMVVKTLNLTPVAYKQIFSDVSITNWFATAVTTASQNDIMSGNKGLFLPHQNISREEIASVLIRAIKDKPVLIDKNKANSFTDLSLASSWAQESLEQAVGIGLITGDVKKQIKPLANTTRAEAVVILKRLLEIVNK